VVKLVVDEEDTTPSISTSDEPVVSSKFVPSSSVKEN